MSWIWNVMLSFGDAEFWEEDAEEALESCPALDSINSWLNADKVHNYGPLTDLTSCTFGNGTGMSANVWGGGFQHFDMEAFIGVVARQHWRDRASVQLFIQGEEESKFTVIELAEPPR
ncbi:MAG: hypothetical protein JWN14_3580, partial [Chthonomonadales bacterium]|nr:hypothetical protein [Chthonomonadales bacterium]